MITLQNLVKNFGKGDVITKVLRGINLEIKSGEFVSIMGKSGAGKSTLLYQMSLLDIPTEGEVIVNGINTEIFSEKERTDFRLRKLGYIFQDYALLPELSAVENVMIPLLMRGLTKKQASEKAIGALDAVNLAHRHDNRPAQLSGGEQQRVAIARAVAQEPEILFADEPTANLDTASGESVMKVMQELHKNKGQTIIMVTHELEYAAYTERVIELEDGQIISDRKLR
ncbi:MAG: ABC transporter ATP-binding protein [Patescibacteria group bacterium]